MLKTQGVLGAAIDKYKSAQAELDALTAQHAGQSERAAELRAEAREAKLAHEQAVTTLKSAQSKFATGAATREDVNQARRAVDKAERAKTDAEELVGAIESNMKGRPPELATAQNRVAAAQRAFRLQVYDHIVRDQAPPGVADWLSRVVAMSRVIESPPTRDAVMRKILAAHNLTWIDCPTGDVLAAAAIAVEQEFVSESTGA